MRRVIIAVMLNLIFSTVKPATIFVNGLIVHHDNTVEKCAIALKVNYKNEINFQRLMNSVTVSGQKGLITSYPAESLKGYSFTCMGKFYKFVSMNIGFEPFIKHKESTFIRVEEEGTLSLYRYYYKECLNNFFTRGSFCYLSKNQTQLRRLKEHNDLLRAISDNRELYASLGKTNKKKIVDQVEIIIRFYNNNPPSGINKEYKELPVELE